MPLNYGDYINKLTITEKTVTKGCSYGKFQPGYRAEISAVNEMNKARPLKFHPGNQAGVFIWEHFRHGYRDLGNWASPPSHMNTSNTFTKEREVRRDLRNRARPGSYEEVLSHAILALLLVCFVCFCFLVVFFFFITERVIKFTFYYCLKL